MLRPFGSVWKDAAAFVFGGPVLSVLYGYNWEVCPAHKAGGRDYRVRGTLYELADDVLAMWVLLSGLGLFGLVFACIATDTMRRYTCTHRRWDAPASFFSGSATD